MPRIVPSEVVRAIDEWFPVQQRQETRFAGIWWLPGIIELIEQIPDELLVIEREQLTRFLLARAALRCEVQVIATGGRNEIQWPMLRQRDCLDIVREALSGCPDEGPSASAIALKFIPEEDLRLALGTDLGSVETALNNGEWKAATIIAGSVIEALLLWSVNQHPQTEIKAAAARKLTKAPPSNTEGWVLFQYIEVAHELGEVGNEAANAARLAKDFRNLIHPGRAQRIGMKCDRATAHSAIGAVLHVIRDLAAKHA